MNCELSGDNGKGEESQEDEDRCQEVHLPTGRLEVKSIKVRVADDDFDQARPGVEGVVVEDGEAGRDGDGHQVLESAHCGVDFPKVRLWHQF